MRLKLVMRYRIHRPDPPLSAFIEYLWSLEDAPAHTRERIVPSGTLELVINLVENEFRIWGASTAAGSCHRLPGAIVSGCYRAPFEIDASVHAAVVGVHFRPAGAAAFFRDAPGDLADSHVALEDLWGRQALELRERLCAASSTCSRFQILERVLESWLACRRDPRSSVQQALSQLERPGIEVGQVGEQLCLSRRRFIEIFTEDVGMTPKRFVRVRRFQRALTLATASASPHWVAVALECGYFDQAHLCRDWAELTGVSPSEFVALRQSRVKDNHLALPEAGGKIRPRRIRTDT